MSCPRCLRCLRASTLLALSLLSLFVLIPALLAYVLAGRPLVGASFDLAKKGGREAVNAFTLGATAEGGSDPNAPGADALCGRACVAVSPLFVALEHGHLDVAAALLGGGAAPDVGVEKLGGMLHSVSPFAKAFSREHSARKMRRAVRMLLDAGASPDRGVDVGPRGVLLRISLMHFALWGGGGVSGEGQKGQEGSPTSSSSSSSSSYEAVQTLLKAGGSPSDAYTMGPFGVLARVSPLFSSLALNDTRTASLLLRSGADPSVSASVGLGLLGTLSPMFQATLTGNTAAIRMLLEAGTPRTHAVSLGPQGSMASVSPLLMAASSGDVASVEALVEGVNGKSATWVEVDPDRGLTLGPWGCLWSDSPLFTAVINIPVEGGEGGAAEGTAEAEEAAEAAEDGRTVVNRLLEAGASPNLGSRIGPGIGPELTSEGMLWSTTPLFQAVLQNDTRVVELLLR